MRMSGCFSLFSTFLGIIFWINQDHTRIHVSRKINTLIVRAFLCNRTESSHHLRWCGDYLKPSILYMTHWMSWCSAQPYIRHTKCRGAVDNLTYETPNVVVLCITLLFHCRLVSEERKSWGGRRFHGFLRSLQPRFRKIPYLRPPSLHSTLFSSL
jgi:hypothetical protein